MLDERKAAILKAVVEEYIGTARPVGSGSISQASGVRVSSATVRNEMAVLEQEGYLHQPHTSAGRVPTEKGYRFFVDTLGEAGSLDKPSVDQVRSFFTRAHGEIEQMLADTSRLLVDLTQYASVVVGTPHESVTVRSAQLVLLAPRVVLAVAVLSDGHVDKHTLDLDDEVTDAVVADASAHLATTIVGAPLGEVARPAPTGSAPVDALVAAAVGAFGAGVAAEDHVYVGGQSQMVSAFDAIDTVSRVLTILEQQLVVVSLLSDVLDRGLSVAIGTETGLEPLADCALIVAPYDVEGERAGAIAVLGPSRMHYPQALAAVAIVSQNLSRRLSEA